MDDSTVLVGAVTFRKGALGSKGQPDRTLPMIPAVRQAFVAAWNHRPDETPWVLWNHRDVMQPTTYGSMNQALKKLERAADVEHKPHRAFHAFRRAIATALIERLGLAHASRYLVTQPVTGADPPKTNQGERASGGCRRYGSDPRMAT